MSELKLFVRLSGTYPDLSLFEAVSLLSYYFKVDYDSIKCLKEKDSLYAIVLLNKSISPKIAIKNLNRICSQACLINGIGIFISSSKVDLSNKSSNKCISQDNISYIQKFAPKPCSKTVALSLSNFKNFSNQEKSSLISSIIGPFTSLGYRVDLLAASLPISLHYDSDVIYCSIFYNEISKQEFEKIKPHDRPFNYPITLQPKLARGILNILLSLSSKPKKFLDVFTGTGTFIWQLEILKSKLGKKIYSYGCDASQKMLEGVEKNLKFSGSKNFTLLNCQSQAIQINSDSIDIAIADFPFGKGSKIYGNDPYPVFISKTLSEINRVLKKNGKLVAILPYDFKLKKTSFKALFKTRFLENKDLGRQIIVLSKN